MLLANNTFNHSWHTTQLAQALSCQNICTLGSYCFFSAAEILTPVPRKIIPAGKEVPIHC